MNRNSTRFLALLLSVCLLFGAGVPAVYAEEVDAQSDTGVYEYDFGSAAALAWLNGSTKTTYAGRAVPETNVTALTTWNNYYTDGTLNWSYPQLLGSDGKNASGKTVKRVTGDSLSFGTYNNIYHLAYKNSSSTEKGWFVLKIKAPALGNYSVTLTHTQKTGSSGGSVSGDVLIIPAFSYSTVDALNSGIAAAVSAGTGKLENTVCYNAANKVNVETALGTFRAQDAAATEYLVIFTVSDNLRAYPQKLTFTPVETVLSAETYTLTTAATTLDTMETDYNVTNNWKIVAKADTSFAKYEMSASQLYLGYGMSQYNKWVAFQLLSPGSGTFEVTVNTKSPGSGKTGASIMAYLLNAADAAQVTDYSTLLTEENKLGYAPYGAQGLSGNFGTYVFEEGQEYILILKGEYYDPNYQADNFYLSSIQMNQVLASVGTVNYTSVAAAAAAATTGQTVKLHTDYLGELALPFGVSLDMNGYDVTIPAYRAMCDYDYIMDSVGGGVLRTNSLEVFSANNNYIPLWDPTVNGYKLFAYTLRCHENCEDYDGAKRFWFKLDFANKEAYSLIAAGTSKLSLGVDISWDNRRLDVTFARQGSTDTFAAQWAQACLGSDTIWLYINIRGVDNEFPYALTVEPTIDIADQTSEITNGKIVFDPTGVGTEGDTQVTLDGKKVIFIGNSHTYYGKTVLEKAQSVQSQEARSNDQGFFYQLCKANGMEVEVTNWTYGGHTLAHLFEECTANRGCDGVDHKADLTDRYFDYVMFQPGTSDVTAEEFMRRCEVVMAFFREANPNVQFVFLMPHRAYWYDYEWFSQLKVLEDSGVIIVDWGNLVNDIIDGTVTVPNAAQTYDKHSFIISQSEADGYHANMLTGYITTLMTYCAITGESAVNQTYSFCNDKTVNAAFDFDAFITKYYTYGDVTTNFPEIFASQEDMTGIQMLIDAYLEAKYYRYN